MHPASPRTVSKEYAPVVASSILLTLAPTPHLMNLSTVFEKPLHNEGLDHHHLPALPSQALLDAIAIFPEILFFS